MMVNRAIIMGVFFLADILATYFYVNHMRRKYPKIDCRMFEYNPIIQWVWGKFGYGVGTIVAGLILSPLWLFVVVWVQMSSSAFFMALGMYLVVLMIHWSNIVNLVSKQETEMSKLYKKAYGGD